MRAAWALLAGLCAAPGLGAWGDSAVSVNAGADADYLRHRKSGHDARPESYVLAQGNSFGGLAGDRSIEKAKFSEIVRVLAPDLAVARYFPARDPKNADLLIVVHWGMTAIDHFSQEQALEDFLADAVGHASPSGEPGVSRPGVSDNGFAAQDIAAAASQPGRVTDNPQLLGYGDALKRAQYDALGKPWGESKAPLQISEETFGEDIFYGDERYFVILEAYNLKSIKEGRKGVKPKLLWSVHYSLTATGRDFPEALAAMSKVAAPYFGRQTDGLLQNAGRVPTGRVEIGVPTTVDDRKPN